MSATTTLAPWWANTLAVHSPMPLAPPVIKATFPSSLHVKGNKWENYPICFLYNLYNRMSFQCILISLIELTLFK
jgi:hypothetical protein